MNPDRRVWKDRPVLVTGGTGFLGSWLCHALAERGARVVALGRGLPQRGGTFERLDLPRRVALLAGDVRDASVLSGIVARHEVEWVFHAAGCARVSEAQRDPGLAYGAHVAGTWNVLEAVRGRAPRCGVVLVSSDAVYGDAGEEPCTEDRPLLGTTPYAASKICAEMLARSHASTYGLRIVCARLTNVYGGGDPHAERIVPGTIASVLRGEPPVVRGDGRATRDYLHVEDAVEACLRLAEALAGDAGLAGEAFNVASERRVDVLELVGAILRAMDRQDLRPQVLGEPRAEPRVKIVSAAKARARLGWAARVPLEAGLERAVAWSAAPRAGSRDR